MSTSKVITVGVRLELDTSGLERGSAQGTAALDRLRAVAEQAGSGAVSGMGQVDVAAAALPPKVQTVAQALDAMGAGAAQAGAQAAAGLGQADAAATPLPPKVRATAQALDAIGAGAAQAGAQAAAGLGQADAAATPLPPKVRATAQALDAMGAEAAQAGAQAAAGLGQADAAATPLPPKAQAIARALDAMGAEAAQAGTQAAAGLGQAEGAATALPPKVEAVTRALDAMGDEATQAGAQVAAAGRTASNGLRGMEMSARQTQAAMRMLPAQMTDIVVGLSTGQSPFMVMMQQGGQLKDMFGGIGPALRAVGSQAAAMVNPLTAAAAAAGLLVVAYESGIARNQAFEASIIKTGNAIGVTAAQLKDYADQAAKLSGTNVSAGGEAVLTAAETGKVAAEQLALVGAAASAMNRTLGTEIPGAVDMFVKLADEPSKAAAKLNEQLNFLSLATYQRIRELEEQGRKEEAAALAVQAAATVTLDRMAAVQAQASTLGRSFAWVKDSARDMWAAIAGGTVDAVDRMAGNLSTAKQLDDARRDLANHQRMAPGWGPFGSERQRLQQNVNDLSKKLMREQDAAAARAAGQAEQARAAQEGIAADQRVTALRKRVRTNADLRREEIGQLDKDRKTLGLSQGEYDKLVAGINERYKDPKGGGGAKPRDTTRVDNRAQMLYDVEAIRAQAQGVIDTNANTDRVLQARRAAGLIDEGAYYATKKRLLDENTAAQVRALEQENARLGAQSLSTKDALDRDRRVLANRTQIAKLQADAAAQQTVLDIQAADALRQRESALLAARQAAEEYLAGIETQQARAEAAIGRGSRQREHDNGFAEIEGRYEAQRRTLDAARDRLALEGKWTADSQADYDKGLRLIEEFQGKAEAAFEAHFARLNELQLDWTNGASEAIAGYLDDAANVAAQSKTTFDNAFRGMEDALASFVTTGKADFKGLALSIIADIARMQARAAMASVIGGAGGSSGWLTGLIGGVGGGLSGGTAATVASAIGGSDALGTMIGLMGLVTNAKGGVYDSPSLSAYSNEVHDAPRLFAFAKGGVFGEAGPEAIMPLGRDGQGRLGVRAQGAAGGGSIHFAPVTHVRIDGAVDRARAISDTQRIVAEAGRRQMDELQQMRVVPSA